jgi:hypothetical protein
MNLYPFKKGAAYFISDSFLTPDHKLVWNLHTIAGRWICEHWPSEFINPLNAELNPICHLLALLGGTIIVVISRLRVNVFRTRILCSVDVHQSL